MTNKDRIILSLHEGHRITRLGKHSWGYEELYEGKPSLQDRDTSALFRANLVYSTAGEMRLTIPGKIAAKRLIPGTGRTE